MGDLIPQVCPRSVLECLPGWSCLRTRPNRARHFSCDARITSAGSSQCRGATISRNHRALSRGRPATQQRNLTVSAISFFLSLVKACEGWLIKWEFYFIVQLSLHHRMLIQSLPADAPNWWSISQTIALQYQTWTRPCVAAAPSRRLDNPSFSASHSASDLTTETHDGHNPLKRKGEHHPQKVEMPPDVTGICIQFYLLSALFSF